MPRLIPEGDSILTLIIRFVSVIMTLVGVAVMALVPLGLWLVLRLDQSALMTDIQAVCLVAWAIFTMVYHCVIAITGLLGILSAMRRKSPISITCARTYLKLLITLLAVGLVNAAVTPTVFKLITFDELFMESSDLLSWSSVIWGIISLMILITCTCSCFIACAGINLWNLSREQRHDAEVLAGRQAKLETPSSNQRGINSDTNKTGHASILVPNRE